MSAPPALREGGKVLRLKLWMAGLALGAAALGTAWNGWGFGAGILAGGAIVLLNLFGTEVVASRLFSEDGGARWPAVLLHLGKLGLTAAVVAALLVTRAVSPCALLLGLAVFPVAAVLDLLFFPVRDQGRKEGLS